MRSHSNRTSFSSRAKTISQGSGKVRSTAVHRRSSVRPLGATRSDALPETTPSATIDAPSHDIVTVDGVPPIDPPAPPEAGTAGTQSGVAETARRRLQSGDDKPQRSRRRRPLDLTVSPKPRKSRPTKLGGRSTNASSDKREEAGPGARLKKQPKPLRPDLRVLRRNGQDMRTAAAPSPSVTKPPRSVERVAPGPTKTGVVPDGPAVQQFPPPPQKSKLAPREPGSRTRKQVFLSGQQYGRAKYRAAPLRPWSRTRKLPLPAIRPSTVKGCSYNSATGTEPSDHRPALGAVAKRRRPSPSAPPKRIARQSRRQPLRAVLRVQPPQPPEADPALIEAAVPITRDNGPMAQTNTLERCTPETGANDTQAPEVDRVAAQVTTAIPAAAKTEAEAPSSGTPQPSRSHGPGRRPPIGPIGGSQDRLSTTILYLNEVTVSFDGFKALNGLNFYVDPGEMRAVIGPNGAGKTTMMDVITGKTKPQTGDILFNGKVDLTRLDEAAIARLGIGRKFQKPTVFENHTVTENLELALQGNRNVFQTLFARLTGAQKTRLEELLQITRLTEKNRRLAGELSHGEKQWLEIGMLLAQDPELLFLDEPAAGMTDAETEQTAILLRDIAGQHSVVVVEHDMAFIRSLGVRVTVLHEGRVIAEGPMDKVQEDPHVIEVYLGR